MNKEDFDTWNNLQSATIASHRKQIISMKFMNKQCIKIKLDTCKHNYMHSDNTS